MTKARMIHGDAISQIARLATQGVVVDAVICDPPYGTTQCKWDSCIPLRDMWDALATVTTKRTPVVLFAAQPFTSFLVCSNPKKYKYSWVWQKDKGTGFLNAKRQPLRNTEDVCVFYGRQACYNPQFTEGKPYTTTMTSTTSVYGNNQTVTTVSDGRRYPTSVLKFSRDKDKVHPTQKPVALLEYLIRTYTNPGDTVLDFTMGSGSTGVAAINTGRNFVGVELDRGYFDIACDRVRNAAHAKGVDA